MSGILWRQRVMHGIAWNSLYQVFQAAVSFAAMLVLARIIPPSDYGRAAAVVGWLTLLNTLNCSNFIAHSLQLPEGVDPDWSAHFSAGIYIQGALSILCNLLALCFWRMEYYRAVAPLLHIAAVGLLVDCPNQLCVMMLRRAMDFRRYRLIHAAGTIVSISVILCAGIAGAGAYGIVLGSNVVTGLPFGIYLLLIRRWRPRPGWWRFPQWSNYRPSLVFGLQQVGSALVNAGRGTLEAAVLPRTYGFATLGLWNRAQALYNTSAGRIGTLLMETVYPVLPRYSAEKAVYARHATTVVQSIVWLAIPGALYLGLEGPALSRLLYGRRWIAADPMIWPGALVGLGLAIFGASAGVLLAANRLRGCFLLNVFSTAVMTSCSIVALAGGSVTRYAWAVAMGQLIASAVALLKAAPLLLDNWKQIAVVPALIGNAIGCVCLLAYNGWAASSQNIRGLLAGTAIYGAVLILAHRILFPRVLAVFIMRLPGSEYMASFLRLSVVPSSAE